MKKLALVFTLFVLAGCSIDQNKAKSAVEALEQRINTGDYAGATQYYSEQMNLNETPEQRAAKFKQLYDVVGDFVSMECLSAVNANDANDQPCVNLEYKVKRTKINTIEDFTVVKEEGKYKISDQNIKQQ
ncbi:MAG TPA: hypothetical protein VK553_02335 [Candidatus Nitrosopolaris rasttigaisensis]|nr:hypothetical protein [Candidatus Nitrosopolaris rasttigaisensis]